MGKWVINQTTVDLRQANVDFCATPDGAGYKLAATYTPADRPREQDDTKRHDNRICFFLSEDQYTFLLAEMERGFWRS